jgi:uncharacterized protein YukE
MKGIEMTPQYKAARDAAALECYQRLCPHQERHDEYMATGRSTTAKAFVEGYDAGYAQGQAENTVAISAKDAEIERAENKIHGWVEHLRAQAAVTEKLSQEIERLAYEHAKERSRRQEAEKEFARLKDEIDEARKETFYKAASMDLADKLRLWKQQAEKLRGALEEIHTALAEGGAYTVEDGFEEPEPCRHYRLLGATLAEYAAWQSERAEGK